MLQPIMSFDLKMSPCLTAKRLLVFTSILLNLNFGKNWASDASFRAETFFNYADRLGTDYVVLRETFHNYIAHCVAQNSKVISINSQYTHDSVKTTFMDIQTEFIKKLNSSLLVSSTSNAPQIEKTSAICNIIYLDSYEGLKLLAPGELTKNTDINEYHLIIWQHVETSHQQNITLEETLQKVVSYFWEYHLKLMMVVLMPAPHKTRIYSYSLFSPTACRVPLLKKLPIDFFRSKTYFLYGSLGKWYGCPIKVAAAHNPPYVILSENGVPSGIEWQLVENVAKIFNATVQIIPTAMYVESRHNQTISGASLLLLNRTVDLAMGGLARTADLQRHFTPSSYYLQSSVLPYIIPVWQRIDAAELLLEPFQWPVWFTTIVCILFSMSLMRPLSALTYLQRILSIVIGSPTNLSNIWRLRYNLMLISLLMLVLRSSYLGIMFKILSQPQQLFIRNVQDLVDNEFSKVLTPTFSQFVNNVGLNMPDNLPLLIDNSSSTTSFDTLESEPEERYVTFSSTICQQYHYTQLRRQPNVVALDTVLYRHSPYIYYRKHFFFKNFFDALIEMLRDIGMITNYRRQYVDGNFKSKSVKYFIANRQHRPLTFGQYMGFFTVILMIWGFSVIIFIMEIIWYRYKHNNNN